MVNSARTAIIPKVISTDSSAHTYEYTVEEDGYIAVSYITNQPHILNLKNEKSNAALLAALNEVKSNVDGLTNAVEFEIVADNVTATIGESGYYINNLGNKAPNASFNITSPITLHEGDKIVALATGYLQAVAVIAEKNGAIYTPLVISDDSTAKKYSYIANADIDVVISSNTNTTVVYSIVNSDINSLASDLLEVEKQLNDYEKQLNDYVPLNVLSAFSNITCIGDSLTY
jgi:hypothetical protein